MRAVRKLAVAGALAAASVVPCAVTASAQSIDYGETCTMGFAPPSPFEAGATVTVDGDGFQPNFTTEILFDGTPAQAAAVTPSALVTTDAAGSFTVAIIIPSDAAPGAHVITAMCSEGAAFPNEFPVEILGGQVSSTTTTDPGGRTTTPRTGTDTDPLVAAGLAAILGGVAIVMAAKRRNREGSRA
jgi:LPXTG-motif cell wall-anchored protein